MNRISLKNEVSRVGRGEHRSAVQHVYGILCEKTGTDGFSPSRYAGHKMTLHQAGQDFKVAFDIKTIQEDITTEFCLPCGDQVIRIPAVMIDDFNAKTEYSRVKHSLELLFFHRPVSS
ncbi:hypothetical protein ES703_124630 [subsurface metagenome]